MLLLLLSVVVTFILQFFCINRNVCIIKCVIKSSPSFKELHPMSECLLSNSPFIERLVHCRRSVTTLEIFMWAVPGNQCAHLCGFKFSTLNFHGYLRFEEGWNLLKQYPFRICKGREDDEFHFMLALCWFILMSVFPCETSAYPLCMSCKQQNKYFSF